MTFTYDGALATDLDKVRFEIGDRTSGAGLRPDSANFTNEEIGAVLTLEGSWGRAAARLCEVLANEWSSVAGSVRMADYAEDYTKRAEMWRRRAQDLRVTYGGGGGGMVSVGTIKVDGYSDDVASDEVDASSSNSDGDFNYIRPE